METRKLRIGSLEIDNALLLAPMEGITDIPFRIICRRLGADIVYSEFIAAEALIRDAKKSFDKMIMSAEERPVAVQIFGGNPDSMAESARITEEQGPDILDINFGCWVKKVVNNNAGAALLKDPARMAEITRRCAEAVKIPVTVKTRLGWDKDNKNILDFVKSIEDAGARAITIHCRTRDMGMKGDADWTWIDRIKEKVSIPVILNGDVVTPGDALRAFETTGCDAVMIGRAVVGNPFLFRRAKSLIMTGSEGPMPSVEERINTCLAHLELNIQYKGFPRGLFEFRKHYSGYLRGMYNASLVRQKLVVAETIEEVKSLLNGFYDYLAGEGRLEPESFGNAPKVVCRSDSF